MNFIVGDGSQQPGQVTRQLKRGAPMGPEYDERFDELTGLVKKVAGRVDEMQLEMRDMRKEMHSDKNQNSSGFDRIDARFDGIDARFDGIDARFDKMENGLQLISGWQSDVIPKVIGIQREVNRISETQSEQTFKLIELMNRLDQVNRRLSALDQRTVLIDSDIKEIRAAINALIDPVLDGKTLWSSITHLEERIAGLEEKLSS